MSFYVHLLLFGYVQIKAWIDPYPSYTHFTYKSWTIQIIHGFWVFNMDHPFSLGSILTKWCWHSGWPGLSGKAWSLWLKSEGPARDEIGRYWLYMQELKKTIVRIYAILRKWKMVTLHYFSFSVLYFWHFEVCSVFCLFLCCFWFDKSDFKLYSQFMLLVSSVICYVPDFHFNYLIC